MEVRAGLPGWARVAMVALAAATLALVSPVHGADWPAQIYRTALFRTHGWLGFDTGWYGGSSPLAYSVLFPFTAATVGTVTVVLASAVLAAVAFARVIAAHFGSRSLVGPYLFAAGTAVPVLVGELPFLMGMALGLFAVQVCRRFPWLAAVAAVACGLTSSVAAAFLALAAVAALIGAEPGRRRMPAILAASAAGPVALLALGYGQGGFFPFRAWTLLAIIGGSALAWLVFPKEQRVLRTGTVLYAGAALVLFVLPSPVGGLMTRLGGTVAAPIVLAGSGAFRRRLLVGAGVIPLLLWQWSPVFSVVASPQANPAGGEAFFAPLLQELGGLDASPARIEIPFTAAHWEAAWVAPSVPLARGWERQLDVTENPLFYVPGALTAATYHAWLDTNGVSWVALPNVALDYSAQGESGLLRSQLPYLTEVWSNPDWQLWRVDGAPGLVDPPAKVTALTANEFLLRVDAPGTYTVRIRYSPTWGVDGGGACLSRSDDGWVNVTAGKAATVDVAAGLLPRSESRC